MGGIALGEDIENVNLRAAYVHILGDIVQSVGVILAAILIYFLPEWRVADPICTFVFSIIVMFTTVSIIKDCMRVIMEATPKHINLDHLKIDLYQIEGVKAIHDLHCWSLSLDAKSYSLTVHIRSTKTEGCLA
jgi:zinc transporter 2